MASNNKLIISIFVIPVLIFVGILLININKSPTSSPVRQGQNQVNSSDNYNFTANEVPAFNFPSVAYASDLQKNVSIYNSKGEKMEAEISVTASGNGSSIQINKSQAFIPGKYSLVISQDGKKIEQDFTWGVLAINPNKSVYSIGEVAKLSIAVLDEKGAMVCDALLRLEIKAPDGQATVLSTENGTIIVNPECTQKKYTVNPDYETKYQVGSFGNYQMSLTAVTKNGTYNIVDFFAVDNNIEFDVERTIATRIFPYSIYPVSIKIIAKKDFSGQIRELAPALFAITPLENTTAYNSIQQNGQIQYILWDVALKKGETINIGYNFKAPEISPQFYLLGPLSLISGNASVFEEKRAWQLAIDAIEYSQTILNTTGLVSYWRLGEPSGTNANDEIGTADGTYTNTPTLGAAGALSGDADTAATLTRTSSEYVRVPDGAVFDLGDVYSFEVWFKFTSVIVDHHTLFAKGAFGPWLSLRSDGGFSFLNHGNSTLATSGTFKITDTDWHHYVATKNGATSKVYIDGVDRTVAGTNTTTANTASDLFIGILHDLTEPAGGTIDEPAVYNTALSAATVRSHYEAGVAASAGVPTRVQSVSGKSSTTVTSRSLTITAPAAGSLIVTALSVDKDSGAITVPTGFTLINSYTSTDVSGAFAYKISNGTETSVVWNWTTARTAASGVGVWTGLIGFDVSAEADSGVSVVTSQSTGTTATTAQANELAIAVVTADTGGNVDAGRAWTNSFTEFIWESDTPASGIPGLGMASKTLSSTGTVESTFSASDTGDQMWASIATFKASGGNFRFEGLQLNGLRIN